MTERWMPEFFLGAVRGGAVVVVAGWVEEVMVLQCLM